MSDRDTPDLDAELRHLSAQVDAHARPIGASLAIATARRRRAVRGGGAVAAALVVIVGLITWGLPHLSTSAPVTGSPSVAPVEPPTGTAPLTAERLGASTAGWVQSWERGTPTVPTTIPCENLVEPGPGSITTGYRSGRTIGAMHTVTTYANPADALHAHYLIHAALVACPLARVDRPSIELNADVPDPDARYFVEGAVISWRDGRRKGTVWITHSSGKTSVLSVVGATDPPESVTERVAEAVAADMLS